MKTIKENVIFKEHKWEYGNEIIAFFPDDEHNPGMIACRGIIKGHDNKIGFGCYEEASLGFYHSCKKITSDNLKWAKDTLKKFIEESLKYSSEPCKVQINVRYRLSY